MSRFNFRAWHKGKYYYNVGMDGTYTSPRCVIGGDLDPLQQIKFKDAIIEQSTGLFDKNGKEIFEGDIVKVVYDSRHLSNGIYSEWPATVEMDKCNPSFCLIHRESKNMVEYDFIKCGMQTLEIIGNIHEGA